MRGVVMYTLDTGLPLTRMQDEPVDPAGEGRYSPPP
jgi:hypothetical protein